LKVRGDEQSVTYSCKLFQARGPAFRATAKVLSQALNDVLLAPQERMTMQTAVDGATLLSNRLNDIL